VAIKYWHRIYSIKILAKMELWGIHNYFRRSIKIFSVIKKNCGGIVVSIGSLKQKCILGGFSVPDHRVKDLVIF